MLNLDKSTWTTHRLGEVATNVNKYYAPERDGVNPYVAGPHIDADIARVRSYGSTDDANFPPTFRRFFEPSDVLLHSRGIEKIAVVDRRGVTGEKLFVLRTLDPVVLSQRFLPWLLRSPMAHQFFENNFSGSVNKFLNWRPLAGFEFSLPPLEEQERIADLLWAVEDAIQEVAELATKLTELRTRTLRTCKATLTPLGALASVAQGKSLPKVAQGQRSGAIPWYKVADMGADDNAFGYITAETLMTEQEILDLGGRIVPAGSVVFPRVGAAVLTERKRLVLQPGAMDENHLILLPNPETSPEVLWAIMDQLSLGDLVQRGVVPSLNMKMIRNTEVSWPNAGSMLWVAELVRKAIVAERAAFDERSALRVLRMALLNEIFGGEA